MKHNPEERFPVVTEDGVVTGSATRAECHSGSMLLHPVVHLHVLDRQGRIYLQQRALTKDIQPGKWDTAVGGHVDLGETPAQAVAREAREELSIDAGEARFIRRYVFESPVERELVHTFAIVVDGDSFAPRPAADEIAGARFWSQAEIEAALGRGLLTPNLELELATLIPVIKEALQ